MTSTFFKLATLGALLLLAGSAMAQPTEGSGEVCSVQLAPVPPVDWSGRASYRAKAVVKDGKVVSVEVSSLTTGVDGRAARAMVMTISNSLRAARCQQGDHVFEKTFNFNLPPAAAASSASS